jgi:hypothetical protein
VILTCGSMRYIVRKLQYAVYYISVRHYVKEICECVSMAYHSFIECQQGECVKKIHTCSNCVQDKTGYVFWIAMLCMSTGSLFHAMHDSFFSN